MDPGAAHVGGQFTRIKFWGCHTILFLECCAIVAQHQPEGKLLGREPTSCRLEDSFSNEYSGHVEET